MSENDGAIAPKAQAPEGLRPPAFDSRTPVVGQYAVWACLALEGIERRIDEGRTPRFRGPMNDRLWAAKRAIVSLEAAGYSPERLAALARVTQWAEEGGPPPTELDLDTAEPMIVALVDGYRPQGRPVRADTRRWDAMVPDVARSWLEALHVL